MNIGKHINKQILLLIITFALITAGCEKTELYYNIEPEKAYINFSLASEVMLKRYNRFIYINDSVPNEHFNRYPELPSSWNTEFPDAMAGNINRDIVGWTRNTLGYIFYMPLEPGEQRVIFTNGGDWYGDYGPDTRIYMKDSLLHLAKESYTNVYLTDGVEDRSFHIVTTNEDRNMPAEKGKTLLRIINLSPDVGPLIINRTYDDGRTEQVEGFPTVLPFCEYTAYTSFNTEGLEAELNSLMFSFASAHNPYEELLTTAVPAIEGAMHTLVIQGFKNATTRSIIAEYDPYMGLPLYKQYDLPPSLRTTLRRSR